MPFGNIWMTSLTTSQSSIPIPSNRRQSLYDNSVPLRSNPKMARSLHGNSADPYHCKTEITPWLYITQLKKVMKPNDENACQTNGYQVSHTGPTTLKFTRLPPAPTGDGWACWSHGCNYSWNDFWQIFGSRVLKDRCSNTLKITSSPCGCRGPFITFTPWTSLVVSDPLRPHEPQHARPLCPWPTPEVHPNPCPSSWWCHPTISSSVAPFSSCPQSFPASGSFPKS